MSLRIIYRGEERTTFQTSVNVVAFLVALYLGLIAIVNAAAFVLIVAGKPGGEPIMAIYWPLMLLKKFVSFLN